MASEDWIECRVADVCSSIDYGLTAPAEETPVGPRFLRITDIVGGHIHWDSVPFVSSEPAITEKYRLADGDIVLARTGASTGASVYVQNPPFAVFASYLVRLKIKPEFDSRFVAYFLKSDAFWSYIRGVLGDKSAQPNASATTMTRAPFRAPKSTEQQRAIAHILGTLDDKIELNRRMNETLEAISRAIFKSWFVDFDPLIDNVLAAGNPIPHALAELAARRQQGLARANAEGRDSSLLNHIAGLFPNSFEDSELGAIPTGWEVGALRDVASLQRNSVNPLDTPDVEFLHYSIPSFDSDQKPRMEMGEAIKSLKFSVPQDAVLLSKLNPEIERVWLVDVEFKHRAVCSSEFLALRPLPPFGRSYLYCLLRSSRFRIDFQGLATGTSKSHQRAQVKAVLDLPTLVPGTAVVQAFDSMAQPLLEQTLMNRRESYTLAAIRDALLRNFMSGELRVKDAKRLGEDRYDDEHK
jgi:type I restriction enzyme S subunit